LKCSHVAAITALLFAAQVQAQTIPVEDFAKRAEAWEVSLSPSGNHVAMAVPTPDGKETRLEVVELATGKSQIMRFGKQQHVADIVWTADDQLVVSRAELEPLKARPTSQGELYTTDIKAKNQDVLFGFVPDMETKRGKRKDHGWSSVAKVLNKEPGMALVNFTCWDCGQEPDTVIYKVDTRTGVRNEIERGDKLADYEYDQTGEPRLRTSRDDNDEPVLHFRREKGADWTPLPKSIAGRSIYGARFADDNNTVYALVTDAMEPAQAYRIDLKAGTRTKLAGNSDVAVSGFMYEGMDGIPFAVTYNAAKPTLTYIDPNSEWAQLHAGLMKSFPGEMLSFNSFSRDGNKVLFYVWSDRDIGSYYVYDRTTKKAQKIIDYKPWLKVDAMAQTRPIEFTSRDGQKLFGFYTAKGTGPKPLIVMPHGGPIGPYDSWRFDDDVQFLANRGYAVLQVNFRGSGGRGESFERAGWQQWGGTIQNDITDGVKWTVQNKLADESRICIYGASFGGYSALMQPILNPGMYKCAIGYVGVYDLPVNRKDWNRNASKRSIRINERVHGDDDKVLAEWSPALRAGDVKIPVFLSHGSDDHTAGFNQYKEMEAALRSVGNPAQTFVAAGEGHGFIKPENKAELYRRMEAFLNKNIGPGAK
jgi:dipeptidyl aminopeptidase/acylaminoacyl peptidase